MNEWFDGVLAWHATHSHLVRAMLAGVLVAMVCGVTGCYIILRRMAFLGDAIAHAMLAGVVAGYLLMKGRNPSAFCLLHKFFFRQDWHMICIIA